ncbi:MAG: glycerol dehydratase [Clostridiales bacterium]|nr:glycerol dehydratase [Clostridiales bacterium]
MSNNRPTILIYTLNVDDYLMVEEMCAGIEEEGLLYEVKRHYFGVLEELSYNAANESILGCGIGVEGGRALMSLRNMDKGEYVFSLENPSLSQCRKLGANAARAVKRVAFHDLSD